MGLLLVGCGTSPTAWGDFQSRVLDLQDRFKATSTSQPDKAFVDYLSGEPKWLASIKAQPCYDPALRAARDFATDLLTAETKMVAGGGIASMSLDDLKSTRDSLQTTIDDSCRLSGAMLVATTACKE